MAIGGELPVEHVPHDALPVDDEGDAAGNQTERLRHAERPAHGAVGVGRGQEKVSGTVLEKGS